MKYLNEFDELPEKLADWATQTVSEIKSPEKRHRFAAELRSYIEDMWNDNQELPEEERIQMIVDTLESSDNLSKQLVQNNQADSLSKKKYLIFSSILIIIGLIISIYPIMVFNGKNAMENTIEHSYTVARTGFYAGGGIAVGITLIIIGLGLLISTMRKSKNKTEKITYKNGARREVTEEVAFQEFQRQNEERNEARNGRKLTVYEYGTILFGTGIFVCITPIFLVQFGMTNNIVNIVCLIIGAICIIVGVLMWNRRKPHS